MDLSPSDHGVLFKPCLAYVIDWTLDRNQPSLRLAPSLNGLFQVLLAHGLNASFPWALSHTTTI